MSAAAAAFPNWAILEPFVFRRDDSSSFPDKTKAPIRASATTSLGAPFRIAFSFAEPPRVSRLYAQLPGFPDPRKKTPLAILGAHRHLVLLRVATDTSTYTVQDLFIYSADDPSELRLLPPCTEPGIEYTRRLSLRPPRSLRRRPSSPRRREEEEGPRLLAVTSMGIVSRGEGEQDFAVVELQLYNRTRKQVYADICLFRSSSDHLPPAPGSAGQLLVAGEWDSMCVPIIGSDPDDVRQLYLWQTDAVVPVGRWLCWVDYYRGILFCDVFGPGPIPTVCFLRLPLDKFPSDPSGTYPCSWLYRRVNPIDGDRALRFVNVARNDRVGYGALKFGAGFTVTCHTLQLGSVAALKMSTLGSLVWHKDTKLTSRQLWSANPPGRLPRGIILMDPLVDMGRSHVVHFLFTEYKPLLKNSWLIAIDMNTGIVESFSEYTKGREDKGTVDADWTKERSACPMPFFAIDFPKYLNLSRKMEGYGMTHVSTRWLSYSLPTGLKELFHIMD